MTAIVLMRPTLDGHVRLLALATVALMAALGTPLAVWVGAIGLGTWGGRNRGVGALLGRLAQTFDLLFQLRHPRLQLLDEGLLPEDDLDQFWLGELL